MAYEKYYWLNEESRTFLSRGYIKESAEERIEEISKKAEELLGVEGFAKKFEDYMSRGFYSLSTPVWVNFGKNKGLPISCYSSYVPDSMDGILETAKEIGMMSKYGGGTSAYLGEIRPRGSKISAGGEADGPVHYAKIYDTVIDSCKQAEARRGACAVYLPVEHDDIMDFLDIATEGNPIQNLQYGVTVTDKWLREMKDGDSHKRKIWAKIIQRRGEIGLPYIFFTDTVNNNSPYNELGMKIHSSNLCLTADQRVVTSEGYLTVGELYEMEKELTLFNGKKKVKSTPMLLRKENSEVLQITYENGMVQKVSPNHGIAVLNDISKDIVRTEAKDLRIGDYVALQTEKGLFGESDFQSEAFHLGMYQSREFTRKLSTFDINIDVQESVPDWIWKSNELTIWSYLNGLLQTQSGFCKRDGGHEIYYFHEDKDFLRELQILFTNLGLSCYIDSSYPTKKGTYRLYFKSVKKIEIVTSFISEQGFDLKNVIDKFDYGHTTKVVFIEKLYNEPVYCPTIYNDEHIFISNGLKTFNCSEIALPTDETNSFVCCIGSINLLHWDEIEKTDAVEVYTQFLNAVMDEFVQKAETLPGMQRAYNFAKNHRAIGVGVLGYHSLLQSKLIPFESIQAKQYNYKIFKELKERTESASKDLYKSNPTKYACVRPGYANTTLIAIAPTKSSSFILGQVSMGIEPMKSNYFVKDLAKIRTVYKNPYLVSELQKYNLDTEDTWNSIMQKDGSVQHLNFATKEVFKTFLEISPKEIILQAGQRQQFIDQSQSLNLMIHPSIPAKDINQLYLYAHEEGIKTLYYQYSQNSAQMFSRNILECVNCE